MSVDFVLQKSRKIESLLKQLGALGNGLHELVSSVEIQLSSDTIKATRKVASIRNKYVHSDGFSLDAEQMAGFEKSASFVIQELSDLIVEHSKPNGSYDSDEKMDGQARDQRSRTSNDGKSPSSGWWKVVKYIGVAAGAVISIVIAANK
jgi:hypothetical protein